KMQALDGSGALVASEQVVNENTSGTQDRPAVAALSDGRFAVAWADHQAGQLVVQRYGARGAKVAGDQTAPASSGAGDKATPAMASMNAAGGSFVVAWVDATTKHVRARLLGGSGGFLFNNVDGQSTDFSASVADGHTRANPTVAVGGSGPFIAIGWEDPG